jgi:hypothetical protein
LVGGEGVVMTNPNEELAGRVRSGILMRFLYRDLFQVQLDDGITITAVMPEEFFLWYDPNVHYTRVNRPSVEVEMREAPALPKIIRVRSSGFCGPGY